MKAILEIQLYFSLLRGGITASYAARCANAPCIFGSEPLKATFCFEQTQHPKHIQINLPWKEVYFTSIMVDSQTKRRNANVKIKSIVILKGCHMLLHW